MATGPLILVARNDLGIKSVRELIDHANKNPDKLKFGVGGGTGSSLYLATELLKARTGIKVTIVPYRGAAPALNDLLGGTSTRCSTPCRSWSPRPRPAGSRRWR